MFKSILAEREFKKGLDLAARGRNDLAAVRFARAEKGGIDVKARLVNISTKDLQNFKQTIDARRNKEEAPKPKAAEVTSTETQSVTQDESSIEAATNPIKTPVNEEVQKPRPEIEGEWKSLTLCDESVIEVWVKKTE